MSATALGRRRGDTRRSATAPTRRLRIAQVLVVLALVPVLALYLLPRIVDLVLLSGRLDAAVVNADSYNRGLDEIVASEEITLSALESLDGIEASLSNVLVADKAIADALRGVVGTLQADVQTVLEGASGEVDSLVAALDRLEADVAALGPPVDKTDGALLQNRDRLQQVLSDARGVATTVSEISSSADRSSQNLGGQP